MAGRPKTMLRRITEIHKRQAELAEDFTKLFPEQYRKPSDDPFGKVWRKASNTVTYAEDVLSDLAASLEIRATKGVQEGRKMAAALSDFYD